MLLLTVLGCVWAELVLSGVRLELPGSSPQCCPVFLGHWCGKITRSLGHGCSLCCDHSGASPAAAGNFSLYT